MVLKAAALAAAVFSHAAAGQPLTDASPSDTEPERVVPVLSLHLSTILTNLGTFEAKLRVKEGESLRIIILADPLALRDLVINFAVSATDDPAGNRSTGSRTLSEGFDVRIIDTLRAVDDQNVDPPRERFTFSLISGEHYTIGSSSSAQITILEGVCDRTPQVQDAVLAKVASSLGLTVAGGDPGGGDPGGGPGSNPGGGMPSGGGLNNDPGGDTIDCFLSDESLDPEDELERILDLDLSSQNVTALKQGDFLNLDGLRLLDLSRNRISTLTGGIFADAGALTGLHLQENRLSTLTTDVFSGLDNLRTLELHDNRLSILPASVFSGLTFLSELSLSSNRLSALPPNLFAGLSNLGRLNLSANDGAPFTLTPRWRRTGARSPGAAEVKLIIEEGAPARVTVHLSAEGGTVLPPMVTILEGSTESSTLNVRQTSGEAVVVRMTSVSDLPAEHLGIRTTAGESFVLDEIGPSVSDVEIISAPASGGAYLSPDNETILVAVGFDGEVEVTTSAAGPVLTLETGVAEYAARYLPERSHVSRLVFGYVLEAGDSDLDGVSVGSDALRLNGARITDASQNPASTALGVHAISNAAGHRIIGRKLTLSFEPPEVRIAAGVTTQVELVLDGPQVLTGGESVNVVLTPTLGVELVTLSPITIGRTPSRVPVSLRFPAPASVTTGEVTASASLPNARILSGVLSLQRLPAVSFDFDGAAIVEVREGSSVTLIVRLGFAPRFPVTVHYRIGPGGDRATADAADYTDPGGGNVIIAAGKTTGIISIRIVDDAEVEAPEESFTVSLIAGDYSLGSTITALITIREGVCDRTNKVQDGILHAVGATGCAEVSDAGLREIASLSYASSGLSALRERDFSGLVNLLELNLSGNRLSALPPDSFADLGRLQTLRLDGNNLTEPAANLFSNLSNLQVLNLQDNRLGALPPNVFLNLTRLRDLNLSGNRLSGLPGEVFSALTSLRTLTLHDNHLAEAPALSGLGALEILTLSSNRLTALPEGVFAGLSGLRALWLGGNVPGSASFDAAGDAVLVVDFKRPGILGMTPPEIRVRLALREGAPFDLDVAVQAQGGKSESDQITIPAGEVQSGFLSVIQTESRTTVTLTVPPVPNDVCPEIGQRCYQGFYFVAGEPFGSEETLPAVRLRTRVFLEGALE